MWEASQLKAGSQTPAPVLSALQLCDRGRATLRSFYIKLLTLSGKLKYVCVMSQPFSQEDTVMLSPSVSAGRQQRQRPEARLKCGRAAGWRSPWAGATAAPSLPSCLLPRLSSVCKQINLTSSLSVPTLSLLFSR